MNFIRATLASTGEVVVLNMDRVEVLKRGTYFGEESTEVFFGAEDPVRVVEELSTLSARIPGGLNL